MIRPRSLIAVLMFAVAVPITRARAQAAPDNGLQNGPLDFTEQVRQAAAGSQAMAHAALTPDALQGPPTPAAMYALVGMNDRQLGAYEAAYRAHMAASWDTRWNLVSTLHQLDRAVQDSDADEAQQLRAIVGQLWSQVRTLDEGFDQSLGTILEHKELRRYQEWKQAMQRAWQAQQRVAASSALADGTAP
jgi:hypothetical protein